MEGGRSVGTDAQERQDSALTIRREYWIAITDDVLWQAVKPNHVLNEELRDVWSRHRFCGRDEDRHFG